MNACALGISLALFLCIPGVNCQVFQVDQESITSGGSQSIPYVSLVQSFTPALSAVGFIDIEGGDGTRNNGVGGSLVINLRQDSYNGPIIGISSNVVFADNASGSFRFRFASNIPVNPEHVYFFEPLLQVTNNNSFAITVYGSGYTRGSAYRNGVLRGDDMSFREGVIVPQFNPTAWLNGKLKLSWGGGGSLEQAPDLNGPWTSVDNSSAGSYVIAPNSGNRLFFRVRL